MRSTILGTGRKLAARKTRSLISSMLQHTPASTIERYTSTAIRAVVFSESMSGGFHRIAKVAPAFFEIGAKRLYRDSATRFLINRHSQVLTARLVAIRYVSEVLARCSATPSKIVSLHCGHHRDEIFEIHGAGEYTVRCISATTDTPTREFHKYGPFGVIKK